MVRFSFTSDGVPTPFIHLSSRLVTATSLHYIHTYRCGGVSRCYDYVMYHWSFKQTET